MLLLSFYLLCSNNITLTSINRLATPSSHDIGNESMTNIFDYVRTFFIIHILYYDVINIKQKSITLYIVLINLPKVNKDVGLRKKHSHLNKKIKLLIWHAVNYNNIHDNYYLPSNGI